MSLLSKTENTNDVGWAGKEMFDPQTGLPTLNGLEAFYSDIQGKTDYIYLEIGLEQYTAILQIFGTEVAIRSIRGVAEELNKEAGQGELVGRTWMDRFGVMLYLKNNENPIPRVEALLKRLKNIEVTNGLEYYDYPHSYTCGIVEIEEDEKFANVLKMAGISRRRAILEKAPYYFYKRGESAADFDVSLFSAAVEALQKEEFAPVFTPQYDIESRRIVGASVSVCWQHPEKGPLPIETFLPVLQQEEKIAELDVYILRQACKLLQKWLEQEAMPVPLIINISAGNIYKKNFFDTLRHMAKEYDVPPCLIELELCENTFSADAEHLPVNTVAMKAEGFRISIDHSGKGSLQVGVAKNLPVDAIKIGKGLLDEGNDEQNIAVLKHLTGMTSALGMQFVAQGIEVEEQATFLSEVGCHFGSGKIFPQLMSLEEFEAVML